MKRRADNPPQQQNGSVPHRSANGISLNDLSRTVYPSQLFAPLLVVACGTTASRVATLFIQRVVDGLGEVPTCIDYLMIDGASNENEMNPACHVVLDVAGCGTDPNRGRKVFEQAWPMILRQVSRSIARLTSSSTLLEVNYPKQRVCNVLVIGGAGGSSGGFVIPCLALVHDALTHHRVRTPRIDYLQLGADMPMRDINRDPQSEQKAVVPDTCFNNLLQIFSDFESEQVSRANRPDGSVQMVRHCDQLNSISVMDQSNDSHQLATTEQFIDMVAASLFFRYLTPCGKYLADRDRDHDELGAKGRGSKRRGVPCFENFSL